MATGDIYEIVDWQGYSGELIQNRYYYKQTAGDGDWNDCLQAFDADVLASVCSIQSVIVKHNLIQVTSLTDLADFGGAKSLTNVEGALSLESLPKWDAFGFILRRTTREMRSGSKRIAGVPEDWVDYGVLKPEFQDEVDAVATAFTDNMTSLGGNVYEPWLVRLGEGGVIVTSQEVSVAEFRRITTQNTRKR